jgi:hypothetical protein
VEPLVASMAGFAVPHLLTVAIFHICPLNFHDFGMNLTENMLTIGIVLIG